MSGTGSRGARPDVAHPKRIEWKGYFFEVVSYQPFTDEQALKVVEHHVRANVREILKRRQGEVIRVATALTRDEAARLE